MNEITADQCLKLLFLIDKQPEHGVTISDMAEWLPLLFGTTTQLFRVCSTHTIRHFYLL